MLSDSARSRINRPMMIVSGCFLILNIYIVFSFYRNGGSQCTGNEQDYASRNTQFVNMVWYVIISFWLFIGNCYMLIRLDNLIEKGFIANPTGFTDFISYKRYGQNLAIFLSVVVAVASVLTCVYNYKQLFNC